MKSFLLLLALLLLKAAAFAQQPSSPAKRWAYQDSIPAQPALCKDSRGVQGFIYDKGNGRKEFRRADSLLSINRSALIPAHRLVRKPAKPASSMPVNPAASAPAKPTAAKGSLNPAN